MDLPLQAQVEKTVYSVEKKKVSGTEIGKDGDADSLLEPITIPYLLNDPCVCVCARPRVHIYIFKDIMLIKANLTNTKVLKFEYLYNLLYLLVYFLPVNFEAHGPILRKLGR